MTASALRPKTNMRRLLYFLGISLAVHIVLMLVLSIDYLMHGPAKPGAAAESAQPATPSPAEDKPAEAKPVEAKPAEAKPGMPAAPPKPKDADAEYQKKQKPATDEEKKKAENLRPDLDELK